MVKGTRSFGLDPEVFDENKALFDSIYSIKNNLTEEKSEPAPVPPPQRIPGMFSQQYPGMPPVPPTPPGMPPVPPGIPPGMPPVMPPGMMPPVPPPGMPPVPPPGMPPQE